MKTYAELTPEQQEKALQKAVVVLLTDILENGLRFNDELNGDDLQARIDAACNKAEKMQTPWFASEYILDRCREDLENMAMSDAENAVYLETYENAVSGVL